MGDLSHDGRGTCTRSATHTCGDEHHLGAIGQSLADGVGILLGKVTGDFGLGTCTETLLADEKLVGDVRAFECLLICINNEEGDIFDSGFVHMLDGIGAAATYADHLDDGVVLLGGLEVELESCVVDIVLSFHIC